jgi:hypothetical protein
MCGRGWRLLVSEGGVYCAGMAWMGSGGLMIVSSRSKSFIWKFDTGIWVCRTGKHQTISHIHQQVTAGSRHIVWTISRSSHAIALLQS